MRKSFSEGASASVISTESDKPECGWNGERVPLPGRKDTHGTRHGGRTAAECSTEAWEQTMKTLTDELRVLTGDKTSSSLGSSRN